LARWCRQWLKYRQQQREPYRRSTYRNRRDTITLAVHRYQGEDVEGLSGEDAPGPVSLCISNDNGHSCRPGADDILTPEDGQDAFSEPHVLGNVALVHPDDATTLLLLDIGSLPASTAIDGSQRSCSVMIAGGTRLAGFTRT
jgi:hypothetical protein